MLENKKKIIILSSSGGGGHTAVARALTSYFDGTYNTHIVSNFFDDILGPLDPTHRLSDNKISGEKIYNILLANKWYRAINWYYKLGSWYYNTLRRKKSLDLIKKYFVHHKPDLVISVIPLVNKLVLDAAQELNIPFLLVPTDLDIRTFIAKIKAPRYSKFHFAVPFETPRALAALHHAHIPTHATSTTGFVVRPDFFEPKDRGAIKNEYGVPAEKPVILLLLGAVGVEKIINVAQEITHIKTPAHLIICIGRNETLRKQIAAIKFPDHITHTVVGFTERMSDLMAIADVFITKSGSVSVNEALYMNLPMILDATSPLLNWEAKNHAFVNSNGFGVSLKNLDDLPALLDDLLGSNHKLLSYQHNLQQFEKKHAGNEIKNIIQKMLAQ